jgi:hypothetical protein
MAKKTSSTGTKNKKAETVADDAPVVDQSGEVVEEVAVVKKTRAPRKKAAASADSAIKKPAVKRTRRRADTSEGSAPVMKAYWGVFNPMMVQVAQYNYSEESEAQKAAAELTEKKKAPHFVQIIKKVV